MQGLDASLIGVIPYAAVRLGMYDGLKKLHARVGPFALPYLMLQIHPMLPYIYQLAARFFSQKCAYLSTFPLHTLVHA